MPFPLHWLALGVFLTAYSFKHFHILASQTLTVPSAAVVAIRCPIMLGSTATLVTGALCASSLTCACETEGDQSVTVPFWWPRWIIAVCRFCAIVLQDPRRVRCSATSWPVEVSWYLR